MSARRPISMSDMTGGPTPLEAYAPAQSLVFEPHICPKVWGGRGLAEVLGKSVACEGPWGESWELSALPAHDSRVAHGPLAGRRLGQMVEQFPESVLGRTYAKAARFPWVIKWLDCREVLSVQVHPDDALASHLLGEPVGKSEAWVVVATDETARIYSGLTSGTTRECLERHLADGTVDECLHSFVPQVGDCLYLPAGTVHTVQGCLLAEVCQASDATFRLFDWNRPGSDGRPRPLHVRQSLEAIDWSSSPVTPVEAQRLTGPSAETTVERLVRCEHFCLDRFLLNEPVELRPADRMTVWMVLDGSVTISAPADSPGDRLTRGHTLLIPAAAARNRQRLVPEGQATVLRVTLP